MIKQTLTAAIYNVKYSPPTCPTSSATGPKIQPRTLQTKIILSIRMWIFISLHTQIIWLSNIEAVILQHMLEEQCSISSKHILTKETLVREC